MIQKPKESELESKAHAAVGRAIELGGDVKDASKKGGRMLAKGYLIFFAVIMAFGLLMSDTPIWFKAILLGLGYCGYRLFKTAMARKG